MRNFYYSDNGLLVRIKSSRRPSEKTKPKPSGTWVIQVKDEVLGWTMPSFPEVTWGQLKKMEYLGSVKLPTTEGTKNE